MSTATIHQTIFAIMKTKVSALEKRVLELEEENMALHLLQQQVAETMTWMNWTMTIVFVKMLMQ